jgi:hypothetical protein
MEVHLQMTNRLFGLSTGDMLHPLDGVLRIDAARGIWPERRWRWDLSLGARF